MREKSYIVSNSIVILNIEISVCLNKLKGWV